MAVGFTGSCLSASSSQSLNNENGSPAAAKSPGALRSCSPDFDFVLASSVNTQLLAHRSAGAEIAAQIFNTH
jgi:hypothetical protein